MTTSHEKMHVIRHNHVSAHGDLKMENSEPPIIFDRTLGDFNEGILVRLRVQNVTK